MAGRLDAVISSRLSARSPVAGGEQYEPFLGDRGRIWQAALQQWREHPLLGTGPGRTELAWISDDGRRYVARFVHNDYLELAASQGVVGLVALGSASYLVARPTRDARRRRDPVQVGTQAALVAFAVASAFDFLWRLAILPLVVAVFFGLAGVPDDDDG